MDSGGKSERGKNREEEREIEDMRELSFTPPHRCSSCSHLIPTIRMPGLEQEHWNSVFFFFFLIKN